MMAITASLSGPPTSSAVTLAETMKGKSTPIPSLAWGRPSVWQSLFPTKTRGFQESLKRFLGVFTTALSIVFFSFLMVGLRDPSKQPGLVIGAIFVAIKIIIHRVLRGLLFPEWTLPFEVVVGVTRHVLHAASDEYFADIPTTRILRFFGDLGALPWAIWACWRQGVRRRKEKVNGVPCEWIEMKPSSRNPEKASRKHRTSTIRVAQAGHSCEYNVQLNALFKTTSKLNEQSIASKTSFCIEAEDTARTSGVSEKATAQASEGSEKRIESSWQAGDTKYPDIDAMGHGRERCHSAVCRSDGQGKSVPPFHNGGRRRSCSAACKSASLLRRTSLVHTEVVLLYLHGGGYITFSPTTHAPMVARLIPEIERALERCSAMDPEYSIGKTCFERRYSVRALLVDYRLAPEHAFPAGLEDAVRVYEAILKQFGADNIVVAGDSAGGGLALSLLLSLKRRRIPLPRAAVCISPYADLRDQSVDSRHCIITSKSAIACGEHYVGPTLNPKYPEASPLYADLSGLPPLLIQAGAVETFRPQVDKLAEHAAECGILSAYECFENMPHVFQAFVDILPAAQDAINRMADFIAMQITRHHGVVQEEGIARDADTDKRGGGSYSSQLEKIRRVASSVAFGG